MTINRVLVHIAKLLAALSLSVLAWYALPMQADPPVTTPEETAQHKTRMDDSGDIKDDLREAMEKHDSDSAIAAARRLASIAREEQRYWEHTEITAAIALAAEAVALADRMLQSAVSPNTSSAHEALANLELNCGTCHDLHPERLRDQIKPKDGQK